MTITTTRGGRRTALAALLAVPAVLFALTACSPSTAGGGDDAASGGSGASGGSEKSEFVQYQFDYAACMRDQGIDMPDPKDSEQGTSMTIPMDGDMDAYQSAADACTEKLGTPPAMSAEERAAADEKFLEWATKAAECYRENGYDMPDPKAGEAPEFPQDAPQELLEECGGGGVAKKVDG
ncbi:hypothetical protein [Microbacterium sp. 179-I 3D3 NHS]|uniref:hypothetical protein n=1 Tax=Microbacterium sp. 179-I 3D3 NHS TaxID=3142382 RepID=UPI0039A1FD8D